MNTRLWLAGTLVLGGLLPARAGGVKKFPDFLDKLESGTPEELYKAGGVATVKMRVRFKKAEPLEREGKRPIPMTGLVFDMTLRVGQTRDWESKLVDPRKGLSKAERAALEEQAGVRIADFGDTPFIVVRATGLEAEGSSVQTSPGGRRATISVPSSAGPTNMTQLTLSPDGGELEELTWDSGSDYKLRKVYQLRRNGKQCLGVGFKEESLGVESRTSWQQVKGFPVLKEFVSKQTVDDKIRATDAEVMTASVDVP